MVSVIIALLIVICGGGCIYKLCTSPCNVCGWFSSCSSCCKKKQRSRLVLDDGNGRDTGVAVHTSMESLRGENARRAPGNSASIFNTPHRPRPYTREHRSRSPLNRHKFQAKRSPSMILERHMYATKPKHPRSSSANVCPSPTFSRHTVAEIGGLSGRSGVASGFGTARFQRVAPGDRRPRKYLRDASTVVTYESFRKLAEQLCNFRPGIHTCTPIKQSRVVAYPARHNRCIQYWKST